MKNKIKMGFENFADRFRVRCIDLVCHDLLKTSI